MDRLVEVPTLQKMQRNVECAPVQDDRIVDVPVVLQRQMLQIQVQIVEVLKAPVAQGFS